MTPKAPAPASLLPVAIPAGDPRHEQPLASSRRLRWYGGGIAALLLAGGLILPVFRPTPQAADKPSGKEEGAPPIRASTPAPKESDAPPIRASIPAPPKPKLLADVPRSAPGEPTAPVRELALPSPLPAPALAERDAPPALRKPTVPEPPAVRVARPITCPDRATEEDLRRQLAAAPKVAFRTNHCGDPVVLKKYAVQFEWDKTLDGRPKVYDAAALLSTQPELLTLPFRQGPSRQLNRKAAANLEILSQKLHAYLDAFAPPGPDGRRVVTAALRNALRGERRGKRLEWLRPEAVPALLQILMAEDNVCRRLLVQLLADIPGPKAARALARRAVFDLDGEVRRLAIAALKGRRAEDYRSVLVGSLRYPWPPPAAHAAEALVQLRDGAAVPALVASLSLPDPARPRTTAGGRNVLQEVVCIQHVRSCILCHPPAATLSDPNLGEDPLLTVPTLVPRSALPGLIRAGSIRPGSYGAAGALVKNGAGNFVSVRLPLKVRSDISFLRQDFSVLQSVAGPRPKTGPLAAERQRFDYMVRTRPLSRRELRRWHDRQPADPLAYPQRQAVLFALRGVTGRDVGDTTAAWQKLFPRAELDAATDRLRKALRRADAVGQVRLLAKVRDREGPLWTPTLASVIPDLRGDVQPKAREFLAGRLARLPARELRERLHDRDPEIARAALQAGVQNKAMAFVPELIALLEGPDKTKAQLARAGLTRLTGQSLVEPAAWQAWWKKQRKERADK